MSGWWMSMGACRGSIEIESMIERFGGGNVVGYEAEARMMP